jgi:hypothetical protein
MPKRRIKVVSRATIDTGLSFDKKIVLNQLSPFNLIRTLLEIKPAARGITTKIITYERRASNGISIFETPRWNFTIGIKATRRTRSLTAT